MTITSWNDPVSGDWSVGANWTSGLPGAGDAAIISAPGGPYTVTVSSADFANSLAVNADQATVQENSGSLTIAGGLHVLSGLVSLNKANTIGSVSLSGGTLAVGNASALGTGTVTQSGGELLATTSETLTNTLALSGTSTIAAAHGTTLTLKASITIAGGSTLIVGASGQDGTVIWDSTGGSIESPFLAIEVQAGTFKGADGPAFGSALDGSPISVASGATLDLTGSSSTTFTNLSGGGSIIDDGGSATLFLDAANFSGTISGALSLEASGAVFLSGNNTYTGTTTIDSGVNLELGAGGTTGSIGGGAIVDNGTLFIFRSNAITLANAISGAGGLWQTGSGVTSINAANTYTGGTKLSAGTLAIGNSGALGTGALAQSGGELLATANETLTNALSISGATFAAAHGKTLTEKATAFSLLGGATLNFGAPGQDGTVIWDPTISNISEPFPAVNVQAGALRGASDGNLGFLLSASAVDIDAGATLDLTGNGTELARLTGGGSIIDSGVGDTLTLDLANFSGVISGPLSLVADGTVILSGKNTYAGSTKIESGAIFQLGGGGTIGGGAILDGGTFAIDNDSAVTLANAISGSGALQQFGDGVASINNANTYTGGTTISGTLAIGNGGALGSGTVALNFGELLATANETLTNALSLEGTSTIAAAHGKTLEIDTSHLTIAANTILNIGSGGEDGTVILQSHDDSLGLPFPGVHVQAGTLKAGDGGLSTFLGNAEQTTIDAGASFDLAGSDIEIGDLAGAGSIIDSGAAATLTLDAADFSGTISGALKLSFFNGDATLSGLEDTTGGATLDGATVTNAGIYDLIANANITGSGAGSSFVNNGTFEKTDGVGVSDVATDFVNNGALNVLSGSVQFTGGFTNHGVIHGRVTQSGGVTTVSALTPSDFNEDGLSDILWQNTATGQASVWEMSQNTKTGGGGVSQNPGTSLHAVGTGDFDGDGHSDILLQNMSTGQTSVWEMEGNTKIGGGVVANSPGPVWQAIGSGDFDGDGHSDILFQNTTTGQVSVWEMTASIRTGGGAVANSPGPAWQAIGSGDFDGDGHSDILFQNTTTGRVSIWEMDGNTRTGGGAVTADPGPSWKAIGTGDFNHDGHADILFQNRTSGQVSIWEMDGNTRIGGGLVSQNPGTSWKAIGTGDFNGDGFADILFQNTSGQASIWDMDGTTKTSGGPISPNPGPSWHAVG